MDDTPTASPQPSNPLDPKVKAAWRVQALISGLILLAAFAAGSVVMWFFEFPPLLAALPFLVGVTWLVLALTVFPAIRYRRWRWDVTEQEVRLRRGLIVIELTVIPMVRVQHVDTSQGPILSAFGLSEVRVHTASGTHVIPALADHDAAQLRDRIAVLARVSDDGGL